MVDREQLEAWDSGHVWHAFTQDAEHDPLIIDRAEGCWLVDQRGRRLLDGVSSLWCNLHGHRNAHIDGAVREQLDRLSHATTLGMSSTPTVELARRLAEITPGDLQHVFFASDGASAVEAALKIAFQYWRQCEQPRPEKTTYLALGDAYHGDTLGSTSVGGIDLFHERFGPLLFDVVRVPTPDPRRLGLGTDPAEATQLFLSEMDAALAEHHERIAAVVIEPLVQGAAGMILHPEGYLQGVRELTQKYGVLMIADEIVTGFGRTGRLFGCDHEDVTPDVMCLGKSLTGGYLPLSAAVAGPKVYEAFLGTHAQRRTFFHGHTYGGNPLACAAALAALKLTTAPEFSESVERVSRRIAEMLGRLSGLEIVADTRQLGTLAGVELAEGGDLGTPFDPNERVGYRVCRECIERGVWLRPLGDVVVVLPPPVISDAELTTLEAALTESLAAVSKELARPVAAAGGGR
ncbi:MAG: adenosylmethionine--8-amino-7-oxononanoate transaminase [Planctomycetota bacterium]